MPALYNTVGDLKFYNFISNRYPSGVPAALVRQFVSTAGINRWIEDYAFATNERAGSSRNSSFQLRYMSLIFAPVLDTPTANELITTCTYNANYRFFLNIYYDDRGLTTDNSSSYGLRTSDPNGGNNFYSINDLVFGEDLSSNYEALNDRYDWYTFCSRSPSTLVVSQLKSNNPMGSLETDFRESEMLIMGWMHDSVFPSPPVNEAFRYSGCYTLKIRDANKNSKSYTNIRMFRCGVKNSSGSSYVNLFPRYYPINCVTGSYTAGRFLTDLILIDNSDPFQQVGKVDNRVVCLGRGDFVKGRVYEVADVFGRTGIEHWLCFCAYTPSSMAFPTWTPTTTLSADKWLYWNDANNETDYIMLRVYVEGDL